MWRCRNSAVVDRRALHSDYTSATEKTLTRLNEGGTRAQTTSALARIMMCSTEADSSVCWCGVKQRKVKSGLLKNPYGIGILVRLTGSDFCFAHRKNFASSTAHAKCKSRRCVSS